MADQGDLLPSIERKQAETVLRHIERVAAGLDQLAAEVRREGTSAVADAQSRATSYSSYATAASRAVHAVQWGVANLPLGQLVTDAAEADVYAEQAKTTTEA